MAWHIVEKLLEQVAEHSTLVGKFWVTFFFVLRFLMVVSIADTVFGDEQGSFVCNTLTPGCANICFNDFSPISLIRLWALQILSVSLPTIIFMVYTAHKMTKISQAKKLRQDEMDKKKKMREEAKKYNTYTKYVVCRLAVEIGFMVLQFNIYVFKFWVPELFKCARWPCPNVVDCFVSRPKEKTIMLWVMFATGLIMIVLNLIELYHL
uniref:Gap junction protein n=1 Tax=Ciona intestinalis TaxID=7719 RepID=F6UBN0_CIOIN